MADDGLPPLARVIVPDATWALVEPLLPPLPPRRGPGGSGQYLIGDREVFTAVVYVLTAQVGWKQLPIWFDMATVVPHRRWSRWVDVWPRLVDAAESAGDSWAAEIARLALVRIHQAPPNTRHYARDDTNDDILVPELVSPDDIPDLHDYALGQELLDARRNAGLTVMTLARRLTIRPADVVAVEEGRVSLPRDVLELWCREVNAIASALVARVNGKMPPGTRGFVVDLRSVVEMESHALFPLAQWAENLLATGTGPRAIVSAKDVERMAARWGLPVAELIGALRDLAPLAADDPL